MKGMAADFAAIYQREAWGKGRGSGTGSSPTYCAEYLKYLRTHLPSRVLDLGCGDWQLYRGFDWGASQYFGVDIVPAVIEANRKAHSSGRVAFACANFNDPATLARIVNAVRPEVILVKDVLQHWSNAEVHVWLRALLSLPYWLRVVTVNNWRHFRTPANDALPRDVNNKYRWAPINMEAYGFSTALYYPKGKYKHVARLTRVEIPVALRKLERMAP